MHKENSYIPGNICLAGIEEESIVDGPGIRLAIFVQGCNHNCKGCHNPETHPFSGGSFYDLSTIIEMYKNNPLYTGITFSGGEPFSFQHISGLYKLAVEVHKLGGNVVTYSGYTYEDLVWHLDNMPLLCETDILIDGPFMEELKSSELKFRGSKNQRVLELVPGETEIKNDLSEQY